MPRNLGFVMVTGRQRSSESWPGKKTCLWLMIVLGQSRGRDRENVKMTVLALFFADS